jgi:hypothetical protein
MTGIPKMSWDHQLACYRRSRLSKRLRLLSTANCLEYVRVASIQFIVLIPLFVSYSSVTLILQA